MGGFEYTLGKKETKLFGGGALSAQEKICLENGVLVQTVALRTFKSVIFSIK